jgi:O-succinylbenzoic acid--CoA ligase
MSDGLTLERWSSSYEPALLVDGEEVSFATLARLGDHALRDVPSAGPVAFVARPDLPTLALALAAVSRGRTIVPLHPKRSEDDRARLVARVTAPDVEMDADALAVLATSGSTGEPKLVELSRRAFIASAEASHRNIPLGAGDRWLLTMPFAHTGGLSILTRCLFAGATVVAHRSFDVRAVLESIVLDRVSVLSVVPTMLSLLLPEDQVNALAKAKAILVGGAACPASLIEECILRGVPALTTYGLTETCSQVTVQPLGEPALRSPSDSGFPLEGTKVEILGDDGRALERGEGRIAVRGPTLMTRYLGHPRTNGVFVTEDVGSFDHLGRLRVVGRVDDMIISGGENVHPLEVETKLLSIDGVQAAIVAGLADPIWGQRVAALVVLKGGIRLGDVEATASTTLPSHARPRSWLSVGALPTNAIGKPDRREAARLLARGQSGAT